MWHKPIKKQWETVDYLLLVLIFNSDIYSSFSHQGTDVHIQPMSYQWERSLTPPGENDADCSFNLLWLSKNCFEYILFSKTSPSPASKSQSQPVQLIPGPGYRGILSLAASEPVLAEKQRSEETRCDILGLQMLSDYYFLISWEQIRMRQIREKSWDTSHNWASLCWSIPLKQESGHIRQYNRVGLVPESKCSP